MGKLPPSPCKCCGSANHWDKECPDWNTYLERARRSVNSAEAWQDDESDKAYATAYSILLNERLSSQMIIQPELDDSAARQGFKWALSFSQPSAEKTSKTSAAEVCNASRRTTIEEVDDDDLIAHLSKPKSPKHLVKLS